MPKYRVTQLNYRTNNEQETHLVKSEGQEVAIGRFEFNAPEIHKDGAYELKFVVTRTLNPGSAVG